MIKHSLMSPKEKLEYDILNIIKDNDEQPLGCGAISALLSNTDFNISEATVGRCLRDFDRSDYTEKVSNQGRVLTAKGRERIQHLASREATYQSGLRFAESVRGHTKEDLLEILVARRAIEGELCYLAAKNKTAAECVELKSIITNQEKNINDVRNFSKQDVVFHEQIAKMAKNRVLEAAIALIRQDTQLSPILTHIRKKVNNRVYVDHINIYEAIAGDDPEKAKQAMQKHMDGLVEDVNKYWKKYPQNS